ncbi:hypothetical protein BDZ45DRAFT_752638 [Acephala macrosclerotiorum]|nr:hypothetical protein BDZ45DRAFT_752638 [Acephala macrosclerotiorum]
MIPENPTESEILALIIQHNCTNTSKPFPLDEICTHRTARAESLLIKQKRREKQQNYIQIMAAEISKDLNRVVKVYTKADVDMNETCGNVQRLREFPLKDEEGDYLVRLLEQDCLKLPSRPKETTIKRQDPRNGVGSPVKVAAKTPVRVGGKVLGHPRARPNVSGSQVGGVDPQKPVIRAKSEDPARMLKEKISDREAKRERKRCLSRQRGQRTMSEKERRMQAAHEQALKLESEVRKH